MKLPTDGIYINDVLLLGPPSLQDNFSVKVQEGSENVPVDIRQDSAAFPEPSNFTWMRDGQPLRQNGLITTYSSVTFTTIGRDDAGNYTVFATNFFLHIPRQQVGNDSGSFYLDVLCKSICIHIMRE